MPEKLNSAEQKRRDNLLQEILAHTQKYGIHTAQPHPNRARQFMPFAALKGYHELAHTREHLSEPKRPMTEELSLELSKIISHLEKGCMVSIMHYEKDRYVTTCGTVTRVDKTFYSLCIAKKEIAFTDIFSIDTSE